MSRASTLTSILDRTRDQGRRDRDTAHREKTVLNDALISVRAHPDATPAIQQVVEDAFLALFRVQHPDYMPLTENTAERDRLTSAEVIPYGG